MSQRGARGWRFKLLLTNPHETAVGSVVVGAIEEFRQCYVLRYELTDVPIDGWRKLDVRVRGGHRVRTRMGYFGR